MVIDLNLGDGKGTALIAELRKSLHYKTVPIIVLSTSQLPEDIEDCISAGASKYIAKLDDLTLFSRHIAEGVREFIES